MRKTISIITAFIFTISCFFGVSARNAMQTDTHSSSSAEINAERPLAHKVLFIGDSMTGWMAERMNAYGASNGFDVAAVVWDGSTINKWAANASRLSQYIAQTKPDVIFVSLGLNDLAEKNPESRLGASVAKIRKAAGNIPVIWVGPPSWPGKPWGEPLNGWLADTMGAGHYFTSQPLKLSRQSATNPHPSRDGINVWMDALMEWMPEHAAIRLPGYHKPSGTQFSRPKTFIYKKMKQPL